MECPGCGYILDPFDEECPRCKRPRGSAPAAETVAPVLTMHRSGGHCLRCGRELPFNARGCPNCDGVAEEPVEEIPDMVEQAPLPPASDPTAPPPPPPAMPTAPLPKAQPAGAAGKPGAVPQALPASPTPASAPTVTAPETGDTWNYTVPTPASSSLLAPMLVTGGILLLVAAMAFYYLRIFEPRRQAAFIPTCMSRQHRLCVALTTWAQDHGNTLPDSAVLSPDKQPTIPIAAQYLRCPARSRLAVGYGFNRTLAYKALTDISEPAHALLTADGGDEFQRLYAEKDIDVKRHLGGYVAGFIDGHAELIRAGKMRDGTTVTLSGDAYQRAKPLLPMVTPTEPPLPSTEETPELPAPKPTPAETPTPPTATEAPPVVTLVTVPDVRNMPLAAARLILGREGFQVAITTSIDSTHPSRTVMHSVPAAGTQVPYGTLVRLQVSVRPGAR